MIRSPLLILCLLTGLNLLNYFDRWLVSAVGESMSRELGLTDAEFGAIGTAFLVGYMVASPVLGHLAVKVPRLRLIAGGIALWSAATSASGLARAFGPLWGIRAAVGVGEASYASICPALIDDLTPENRRGRALAIFYAALPVGSALGYVVGGALDKHVGWRNAFVFAGVPGLVLALLTLAVRDPGRSIAAHPGEGHGAAPKTGRPAPDLTAPHAPSLSRVLRELRASRAYAWTLAGYVAQTFALGGFGIWAPRYLVRNFALANDRATFVLGGILVVTGFVGTFLGGVLADRLPGADRMRVALLVCAVSAAVAVPFAFWCVYASTATAFFVAIAVAELGIFTSTSPVNGIFLTSVPLEVRTMSMAVSIFASHALGDVVSSPLVGVVSDATGSLTTGMAVLPAALVFCAALWFIGLRYVGAPAAAGEPRAI